MKNVLFILMLFSEIPILPAQVALLDPSFGTNGIVVDTVGSSSWIKRLHVLDDGSILALPELTQVYGFRLLRYQADGQRDNSFGTNGMVVLDVNSPALAANFRVMPDGKIVVIGATVGVLNDLVIARLTPDGLPDSTFNAVGYRVYNYGATQHYLRDVAVQPDGKLVCVGSITGIAGHDILLMRLLPDGTPDPTFSQDGMARFNIDFDNFLSVDLAADGRIVVAGYVYPDGCVARFHTDGAIDLSFNGVGYRTFHAGSFATTFAGAAVLDNQQILAYGIATEVDLTNYGIAVRLWADGAVDSTFGSSGGVQIPEPAGYTFDALTVQPDGKLLLAGGYNTVDLATADLFVRRLLPNGAVDSTFGQNGSFVLDLPTGSYAQSSAWYPDGSLLLGGWLHDAAMVSQLLLVKLTGDTGAASEEAGTAIPLARISPNPASDIATLSSTLPLEERVVVRLFDALGREVPDLLVAVSQAAGVRTWSVPVVALPAGLYFFKLESERQSAVVPWIRQ